MIRIMTLDAASHAEHSLDRLRTRIEPLRAQAIDLLCCQSIGHVKDGRSTPRREASHLLAETLGLTCSCFASRRSPGKGKKAGKGLATFTGTGVWVLNSGSFTIGNAGEDEEEIVQFALIRKNGASVLALNLHLAAAEQVQKRQLADLFSHALLKDPYGAVVLCADRAAPLSSKQWQVLAARSSYNLHHHLLDPPNGGGLLCLLPARSGADSAVTVRQPEPQPSGAGKHSGALAGLTLSFDIQRLAADKRSRLIFPLSFREQWLGYKEHRAFA